MLTLVLNFGNNLFYKLCLLCLFFIVDVITVLENKFRNCIKIAKIINNPSLDN